MNMENNNFYGAEQNSGKQTGSDSAAEQIFERGAEAYGQADQAVKDAYDKTSEKVNQTYEKARSYSSDNPGKTVLIALGIGIGLGLLLGASTTHRSSRSRFAQPVVHALSDIASEWFR